MGDVSYVTTPAQWQAILKARPNAQGKRTVHGDPVGVQHTHFGDGLYRDQTWLRTIRRWPPRMADRLDAFLALRPAPAS